MNKKSGNSKQNKSENKKIPGGIKNLKTIIICVVGALCLVAALITFIVKKNSDKNVRIAFYGLDGQYENYIKELIPEEENINLEFISLNEDANLKSISKKYDLLFSSKGEVTDLLEEAAREIPSKTVSLVPETLQNKKCLPILLDSCELLYNKNSAIRKGGELPSDFNGFVQYLESSKGELVTPMVLNGGDDRILTAFVGNLVEKTGGSEAYKKLIAELRKGTDFESLLEIPLGNNVTLKSTLELLKDWTKTGLLFKGWYNLSAADMAYFIEEKQTSVTFTFLSVHRTYPWKVMDDYESYLIPPLFKTIQTGVICPSVCAMLFSKNSNAERYLQIILSKQAQEALSDNTQLAPANSRARSYDKQADDVRYWAAGTKSGALPDLYNAAFQTKPEEFAEFTARIRNFLQR